jgi:5,10-methylenetetrahydrofolate reductase
MSATELRCHSKAGCELVKLVAMEADRKLLKQKLKNERSIITAQLFFDNDLFHHPQLKKSRRCVPPS